MQKWDSFSAIPYIYIYVETDVFLIWLGRTNIEKVKKCQNSLVYMRKWSILALFENSVEEVNCEQKIWKKFLSSAKFSEISVSFETSEPDKRFYVKIKPVEAGWRSPELKIWL